MKAGFGKLLRLFSPNPSLPPSSRRETPPPIDTYREGYRHRNPDPRVLSGQVDLNRSTPPLPADAHAPPQPCRIEPAYPPPPVYSSPPMYNHHPTPTPQPSQELPPAEHTCAVCATTDRFQIPPSRCPFTGQAISSPSRMQHNYHPSAGTSNARQVRQNRYGQLMLVEGRVEFRTREDDSWVESEKNTEERAEDSLDADAQYGDYYMTRSSKERIEDWLEWCVVANCPGYENSGEVIGREQRGQGYGKVDEELNGRWDWRFDDELWNNRIG